MIAVLDNNGRTHRPIVTRHVIDGGALVALLGTDVAGVLMGVPLPRNDVYLYTS